MLWYGQTEKLRSGGMRESYWDYMGRRLREECEKDIDRMFSPWEASRKIKELEKRIEELEDANVHVSK